MALKIVPARFDDEHAVFDPGVLHPVGVVILLFIVAPAAAAGLVSPFLRIGQAVDGEFIGPDQLPALGFLPRFVVSRHRIFFTGAEGDDEQQSEPTVSNHFLFLLF